jgi:hypothetical protein
LLLFLLSSIDALIAARAHAASPQEATADVGASLGVTNNAGNTAQGDGAATADGFATVGGALAYRIVSPSITQTMNYGLGLNVFGTRSQRVSMSHSLEYRSVFTLTPKLLLRLGGGGTYARFGDLDTLRTAEGAASAVRPAGNGQYLRFTAAEGLDWTLKRDTWDLSQASTWAVLVPFGETRVQQKAMNAGASLALNRRWYAHSANLTASGGWAHAYEQTSAGMVLRPDLTVALLEGRVGWQHVVNPSWTWSASAGAAAGKRTGRDDVFIADVASAALTYSRLKSNAFGSLEAIRGAVPNLFVGDVIRTNGVSLRGATLLGSRLLWSLNASAGYQTGRSLGGDEALFGEIRVAFARIGITYDTRDDVAYSLDYSFTNQQTDAVADASAAVSLASFNRHFLIFGVTYRYPPRRARAGFE